MMESLKAVDTISPEKTQVTSALNGNDKKIDDFIKGKDDSLFPLPGRGETSSSEWNFDSYNGDSSTTRDFLPRNNGSWDGEAGESFWQPEPNAVPQKMNPDGKTWGDILEPYRIEGIEFKDGEPDFTPVSEATVEIDDFSTSRAENFAQADEIISKKWTEEGKDGKSWTADDVRDYRKEHGLTWHERSDTKTLDLVPSAIHNNVPHSGGISVAKNGKGNVEDV